MHELSIAVSIIAVVEEEAVRRGYTKVQAVRLRVGPMSGVSTDSLLFSYPLATEGTGLAGSRLIIEEGEGQELEIVGLEVEVDL